MEAVTGFFGRDIGFRKDRGLVGGQGLPPRQGCVRDQGFRVGRTHSLDVPHVRHDYPQISTLEEVGQNFAVTRERIRQIEAKALRKLRHPSRSHRLRAFLENGNQRGG